MKIDVQPIIEEAKDIDKLCIEIREVDCLYVVKLANNRPFTVKFTSQELEAFCPNKTVSEMMLAWEESIKEQHHTWIKAIKTKKHPTWKKLVQEFKTNHKGLEIPTGKSHWVEDDLSESQINAFQGFANILETQFGTMKLVKIV